MSRGYPSASGDAGGGPDPVALARALVAVPSVNPELSPDGEGEARIAELCAGWLRGWGFAVETVEARPGRPSLVARAGSGRPRTILNGHLDTVGVEEMEVDPFDPVIRDGRLYGRGACDMKGGLGAALAAAGAVAAGGEPFPGELLVVLTADEEHASVGLEAVLHAGLEADRAVVAEPTSLDLQVANQGFVWVHARVHGRAAHGSRPERGGDAIRAAGRLLARLDEYEGAIARAPGHELLGHGSIHAGTIRGGTAPSVYPAGCDLVLEARTLPGEGPGDVLARLVPLVEEDPRVRTDLAPGLFRPGSEIAPDAPLVRDLERACRVEGIEPRLRGMSAWVESAWFNEAGIPALCFGPGAIADAHGAREHVEVQEIRTAARVFERFIRHGSREA